MDNYVVYHLHSSLSLLDSCTSYKDYIIRAKELGQKAICFTEHGNIFNWVEKKMYCESTQYKVEYDGECKYFDDKKKCDKFLEEHEDAEAQELSPIKYIHGIEVYLTANKLSEKKERDNYHTILIAKNEDGFKELNKLIDLSTQEDHMYYKPRITFDEFLNISDNIIKISACLASPLRRYDGELLEELIKHYDYLEVQPHVNSDDQKEFNAQLVEWAKEYNKPLIAGTDTHSLHKYKAECRSILQKAKHIEYQAEDTFDLTYKTYDELVQMFEDQGILEEKDYHEAINNTNVMADSVFEFELDTSFKYPKLYENEEEVFKKLLTKKYNEKLKAGIITNNPIYKENVKEEFRVFKKIGMIGFMLFMSELVCWCWDNNIPVGFCRGSVGGSTIAYLLDIIDVNPVIWHTVFSRFANEDRKEIGDIDIDISPSQRSLVYEHIIDSFGCDKTAYVLAIGTISDKGTIDDIARALAADRDDNKYSLNNTKIIKELYEEEPDKARAEFPELFYYFDGLVNTPVSQSMHPAGIIVSPVTLPDNYGTFWNDGKRILTINMEEIHEVSLVKYDLLGLKNIEIIKDTCDLVGISYPKSHEIDWDDQEVWKHITDSPIGIFQFEGNYAYDLLKKFQPRKINDLSLVNASLRPSGESYRDKLIAREANKNPSKMIDDLLADNNGWLIYQEDTIKFLTEICGLSGSEADNVRRAIGRKQIDRLQAALPGILEGYCNRSDKPRKVAEEEAKAFLQIIEDSASYQFGFNHSTGYSMIGYVCGYLRYYYPTEFITAYLNNANNDEDINAGTELAKQMNINMMPIKFRHSVEKYSCDADNKTIYKGLASIKFVSENAARDLDKLKDHDYHSFVDFLIDLQDTSINSRQLEILIKLDFFSEFGSIKKLLKQVELTNKIYGKKQFKRDKLEELGIPEYIIARHAKKQTEKIFKDFDSKELLEDVLAHTKYKKTSVKERMDYEFELLGYSTIHDDRFNQEWYYVVDVLGSFKNMLSIYNMKTGSSEVIKFKKGGDVVIPKAGQVIEVLERTERNKMKLDYVDDHGKKHFVDLPEREIVISKFRIIC